MSTVTHPSTRAGKVGEPPARPSASSHPQLHPAYCFLAAPVALALGVAGLVVADDVTAAMVVGLVLVALWAGAGLALGLRRREDRLAPIAFAAALLGGGWLLMTGLATGDDSFIVDLGVRLAAALLPALAFHLLVSLPGGRLVTSSRKGVVLAAYALGVGVAIVLMSDRDELLVWPLALAWLAALGLSLVASHGRYREAGAVDRRRMQWIGWALAVGAEAVLVIVALEVLADWPDDPAMVALALTGLVPLSLIAGTFPKLIGRIDRVLTYTVSLAGLTALIVVVYVVVVVGLARRPEEGERSLLLLSMLAAGIAALLYLPARRWLTERANRLVYGERVAPDETLRTFGQRLTRAIPLDELLLQLAESLRKSLALTSAEIWTGAGGHLELAAGVPHHEPPPLQIGEKELAVVARAGVSGGTWLDIWLPGLVASRAPATVRVSPIAHAGALLGLIVCSRRVDGEAFTERDDLVLTELARQVGLALHNVQLDAALQASLEELQLTNTELLQSRARIVAAGDAERRKLERNLHDGAQQHLVALAVKIRLARDAVEDDPADAVAMLDEVKTDVQDAIQELRALAHGIFPPLLVSGGLTEALRAAGGRSPLPTTVETEGVGRYHQDVEAAVYFCCLEAMQNAAKHAGDGASLKLHVWDEDGTLSFEVVDDGRGFDLAAVGVDGHGFVNMGDRLGAINGNFTIWSAPGRGTRVGGSVAV
jgi:signal transduction histidine kinase